MDAANETTDCIPTFLKGGILDRLILANAIMINEARKKGDQHLRHKLEHWSKIGTFDILNNISDYVSLIKLMD